MSFLTQIQKRVQNSSSSIVEFFVAFLFKVSTRSYYVTFYNMSSPDCNSWLLIKCSTFCIKNILFYPLLNTNRHKWHLRQEHVHLYSRIPNSTFLFLHSYVAFTHNHTNKFYQEKRKEIRNIFHSKNYL